MRDFHTGKDSIIIPCPDCGHETRKPRWWVEAHDQLSCSDCHHVVRFKSDGRPQRMAHIGRHIRGFVSRFAKH